MAGEVYVIRALSGTLIILPAPTLGAVASIVSDQAVNVASLTDVQRTLATLTDQPRATAVLSEKVV